MSVNQKKNSKNSKRINVYNKANSNKIKHLSDLDQFFKYEFESKCKSVLVTGGSGFIGSNLCQALLKRRNKVYTVDNLITGKFENILPFLNNPKFHFFKLDIVDAQFRRIFEQIKIDCIYHLACPTGVPNIKLLSKEMMLTSSLGTLNVLEIARFHNSRILFASSAEVYGQPEKTPQDELYSGNVDPIGPRCPYEEGKRFSESLLKMYTSKYDVETKIVRIFNTYGPGMSLTDQRVIPKFMQNILMEKEIIIYGSGEQTRTFLYVDDLIRGLITVMEKGKKGEAYNVGSKEQITIKELATLLIKLTKYKNGINYLPHFIEDHQQREPKVKKVEALGWRQRVSLIQGLKRMLTANGFGTMLRAVVPDDDKHKTSLPISQQTNMGIS